MDKDRQRKDKDKSIHKLVWIHKKQEHLSTLGKNMEEP